MNKRSFRALALWLIVLLLAALAVTGFVMAKYITTVQAGGGTVTLDARLAAALSVQESKAQRLSTGEYALDQTQAVTTNQYILIPGVDIPKDPRVVITGKTSIPAVLYLKVECSNEAVSFTLRDHWVQVGNSDTYVYSDANGDPVVLTADPGAIYILENDTVYVSHELLGASQSTEPIRFTVTLTEVTE